MTDVRTWPEGQSPTSEQWVAWFATCGPKHQAEIAAHVLRSQELASRCFLMNHEGLVEEVDHLRRAATEAYDRGWREALAEFMEKWGHVEKDQAATEGDQ